MVTLIYWGIWINTLLGAVALGILIHTKEDA